MTKEKEKRDIEKKEKARRKREKRGIAGGDRAKREKARLLIFPRVSCTQEPLRRPKDRPVF
jgi:hypothetical protein